ncbi:MAG: rod shape-determining protein MreC [Nocardioides sp.]|uniref:rod shape-determining protein MreC n=1 Tax=Nocardioides sp. TaxID=35761 RepID=UPI0039E3BBE9
MALLTPPGRTRLRPLISPLKTGDTGAGGPEGLNRRGSLRPKDPHGPKKSTVLALVLACATLFTLDQTSALDPARNAFGDLLSPAESAVSTLARPLTSIPDWFDSRDKLRAELATEKAKNADLRAQLRSDQVTKAEVAQLHGLVDSAQSFGRDLVPARVIAYGPAQSFSRTVTLNTGSAAGLSADMTVIDDDGLVGRILRVSRHTATVLLLVDDDSVVGGRVGSSGEVGMVSGTGQIAHDATLDLDLVDQTAAPLKGESVLSWGEGTTTPYVGGIPIGKVTGVYASLQDSSRTVRIKPYVDFGSLDVVGVVVPAGTTGDHGTIGADGSITSSTGSSTGSSTDSGASR